MAACKVRMMKCNLAFLVHGIIVGGDAPPIAAPTPPE